MNLARGIATVALLVAIAGVAGAEDYTGGSRSDFSVTSTVVSDYRYRGISRSDNNPAVQGHADWANSSGFYAGVWASSFDFGESDPGYVEVAPYGGYKFSFDGTTVNTGMTLCQIRIFRTDGNFSYGCGGANVSGS